jgi:A/G-specific adenine glycosylase
MAVRSDQRSNALPRSSRSATRAIFRWYIHNGRKLPWRDIHNPYRILIAEIMLHQTQVSRVLRIFPRFLKRFPTLKALASARQSDVLVAWRGMGYNNRAVRLHKLANQLLAEYGGTIPRAVHEIQKLPGVGKYTANALLTSVYRDDRPVVDINIRRLFSRLFWRMTTTAELQAEDEVWALAGRLVPRHRGYDWTQALMDLGATICTARAPACTSCPVGRVCRSRNVMQTVRLRRASREPAMAGIPNRIYRGRIVDVLRTSRTGLPIREIGLTVIAGYSERHRSRLRSLLEGLQKDGLIAIRGKLTDGSARARLA